MSADFKRIVVALDYPNANLALEMAKQLDPSKCRVKVGKELFTRCGPSIVESLQTMGFEVFLDLKFHDIPNTTAKAVRAAAEMGVWMVNVHASGGQKMMETARNELEQVNGAKTLLIGVTVLTSMEREDMKGFGLDIEPLDQVKRLALLTQASGLDGVVCSAQEVTPLREIINSNFKLVTPGIRPATSDVGDQKRIMTPPDAIKAGSDYLVIGRPITQAVDPMQSLTDIYSDLQPLL